MTADRKDETIFVAREVGVSDLHDGLRLRHLKALVVQAEAQDYRDDARVIISGLTKIPVMGQKEPIQLVSYMTVREGPE